MNTAFKVATGQ